MRQIIPDWIPQGRRNRPGTPMTPRYITIHDTGNPQEKANAKMHGDYLRGDTAAGRPASWHFTVDDKEIRQHIPLNEIAWHAGDGEWGTGNLQSIAIEICENADGDRAKAEDNAAWLVGHLRRELNLPNSAVVQHNRWSGKNCPRIIRARPGGWNAFLAAVEGYMGVPIPITLPTGQTAQGELRDGTTWIQIDGAWCRLRTWAETLGLVVDWYPGPPALVVVRYPNVLDRVAGWFK